MLQAERLKGKDRRGDFILSSSLSVLLLSFCPVRVLAVVILLFVAVGCDCGGDVILDELGGVLGRG